MARRGREGRLDAAEGRREDREKEDWRLIEAKRSCMVKETHDNINI